MLTKEYQLQVLQYLYQYKEAKKYLPKLGKGVFSVNEYEILLDLLKDYVERFRTQPNLVGATQLLSELLDKQNVKPDIRKILNQSLLTVFQPLHGNIEQIAGSVIKEYQKKLLKELQIEFADKLQSDFDSEAARKFATAASKIAKIGEDEEEKVPGPFLLKDHTDARFRPVEILPTYLKGLNRFTSLGGFYRGQLIIIMGGPKSFKTGVIVNLGVNFVRDGYNVYYADFENGAQRIADRAKQSMAEITYQELLDGQEDEILAQIVKRFRRMGGDMKVDHYPAYSKDMGDIEEELIFLRDEHNWVPDIIIWDYLDLAEPVDKTIKEKRHKLQHVYFDAIKLLIRWNALGISVSQVRREAVSKSRISMQDFAEDFGKAANCHGAFAICGDPEVVAAGYRMIVPVLQRDGLPPELAEPMLVKLDYGRMQVKEVSYEEAAAAAAEKISEVSKERETKSGKAKVQGPRRGKPKGLKDE